MIPFYSESPRNAGRRLSRNKRASPSTNSWMSSEQRKQQQQQLEDNIQQLSSLVQNTFRTSFFQHQPFDVAGYSQAQQLQQPAPHYTESYMQQSIPPVPQHASAIAAYKTIQQPALAPFFYSQNPFVTVPAQQVVAAPPQTYSSAYYAQSGVPSFSPPYQSHHGMTPFATPPNSPAARRIGAQQLQPRLAIESGFAQHSSQEGIVGSKNSQSDAYVSAQNELQRKRSELVESPGTKLKFKTFFRQFKLKQKEGYRAARRFARQYIDMLPKKVHWRSVISTTISLMAN